MMLLDGRDVDLEWCGKGIPSEQQCFWKKAMKTYGTYVLRGTQDKVRRSLKGVAYWSNLTRWDLGACKLPSVRWGVCCPCTQRWHISGSDDIVQFCAQANARYMRQWAAFAAMGPKVPGVKMPLGLEVLSSWTLSLTPAFRKGNLWGFLTCQRSGRRKRRRKNKEKAAKRHNQWRILPGKGGAGFCPPVYSFWFGPVASLENALRCGVHKT